MKAFFISSLFLSSLLLFSCQSKEERAEEIIKSEMFKTLDDFESYEPIETKFDSLKHDVYGDTLVFDFMREIYDIWEYKKQNQKKLERNYYILRYLNRDNSEYQKAKAEAEKYVAEMDSRWVEIKKNWETLKANFPNYDNQLYGWLVTHKYRSKSKDGKSSISTNVYFMNKKCSEIYRNMSEIEMDCETYNKLIKLFIETDSIPSNLY